MLVTTAPDRWNWIATDPPPASCQKPLTSRTDWDCGLGPVGELAVDPDPLQAEAVVAAARTLASISRVLQRTTDGRAARISALSRICQRSPSFCFRVAQSIVVQSSTGDE